MYVKGVLPIAKFNQPSLGVLWFTLAALSLVAVAQNAWYWTQLPNRVATHFDVQGTPNSWMDRTSATIVMLATQVGVPWFLVGVAQLTRYLPPSLVNLPHREYWLRGDRREASLAYLRYWIGWVAIFTSLFMMSISHLTYVANIRGMPLNVYACGTLLVLYLIGIAVLVAAMLRRFRVPV